eukprot:gb/GFBE01027704.1/.p1 GENE.gb/GFBE01027704.1/~~gb/GFBE01027704.1/.p1  ORF type:complete len:424 (+),score=130.29 gb/GFBE01027704.1/:1-1272(+)
MGVVSQFWEALTCSRRRSDASPSSSSASPKASDPTPEEKCGDKFPKASEAQVIAAKELKDKGNEHFKKQEFEEALDEYTKAAEVNLYDASIWLNRSICNRKLEQWDDAATDAEVAMELDPSNIKAYYSRALALQQLQKYDEAVKICKRGLKKQADNKALLQLKADLEKAVLQAQAACPGQAAALGAAQCPTTAVTHTTTTVADIKQKSADMLYKWQNGEPDEKEREGYKKMMVDMFRSKYEELKQRAAEAKSKRSALQTDQYEAEQKQGLQLTGGHRPMERPEHVDLPADYMKPVGRLTVEQLAEFNCNNKDHRYMLSVYGYIFDVSDRPDKYNPDGPYSSLTGRDLTWGLFAGVDTVDYTNKFYDLFKAKDQGKDKLAGLCSWLAWYETEYGTPIGRLEPWTREATLPEPPLDEIEEACTVM